MYTYQLHDSSVALSHFAWLFGPIHYGVYKYFSGFSGSSGAGEMYLNTDMAVVGAGEAGEVFKLYTLLRRWRSIYIHPIHSALAVLVTDDVRRILY